MEFVSKTQIKRISDCIEGELIRFSTSGNSIFGLTVRHEKHYDRYVILPLKTDIELIAFNLIPVDTDDWCASYGQNWVLECIESDKSFPGAERKDKLGILVKSKDGFYLKINDENSKVIGLDLNTLRLSRHVGDDLTPAEKWRIWSSKEDMNCPTSTPLFEFSCM